VAGENLDQDDADAAGVLDPHPGRPQGSVAGARMTGTPAAASRACSVPALTRRKWQMPLREQTTGARRPGNCLRLRRRRERAGCSGAFRGFRYDWE
jgi:hypothetical protein